jgi:hypothetical protein
MDKISTAKYAKGKTISRAVGQKPTTLPVFRPHMPPATLEQTGPVVLSQAAMGPKASQPYLSPG